jgi:hypothetical protein
MEVFFHPHATGSRHEMGRMAEWSLLPGHLMSLWAFFMGSEPVKACCHTARAAFLAGVAGGNARQFDHQGNTIKSFPLRNARSSSSKGHPDLQEYLYKFC